MTSDLPPPPDAARGQGLIRLAVGGTIVLTVVSVLGVIFPSTFTGAVVVVSMAMFLIGSVATFLAFLRAVDRSRTEEIGIGGLFFGAGSTPIRVQVWLMGSLAVEVVVTIAVAAARPYTAMAFAVLAPMWGLGFAGMWVAAYGTFPEREPELTRTGRRQASQRAHQAAAAGRRGGGSKGAKGAKSTRGKGGAGSDDRRRRRGDHTAGGKGSGRSRSD